MFKRLNDIKYSEAKRFSTGIADLDWIYSGKGKNWGLPEGKISLWSGPSGCGKSRSLITLSKRMSEAGHNVIYFQNEVNLGDFRSWAGNEPLSQNLYASDSTSLKKQIDEITMSKSRVAIIDSIGLIDEFGNGHESKVKDIYSHYRELCKKTGVHVIFVCQLNSNYQIKGSTSVLYLADISVDLDRYVVDNKIIKNHFRIGINGRNGGKHRYGPMGDDITTLWKYSPEGAECVSTNRLKDKEWCNGHDLQLNRFDKNGYDKNGYNKLGFDKDGHYNEQILRDILGDERVDAIKVKNAKARELDDGRILFDKNNPDRGYFYPLDPVTFKEIKKNV